MWADVIDGVFPFLDFWIRIDLSSGIGPDEALDLFFVVLSSVGCGTAPSDRYWSLSHLFESTACRGDLPLGQFGRCALSWSDTLLCRLREGNGPERTSYCHGARIGMLGLHFDERGEALVVHLAPRSGLQQVSVPRFELLCNYVRRVHALHILPSGRAEACARVGVHHEGTENVSDRFRVRYCQRQIRTEMVDQTRTHIAHDRLRERHALDCQHPVPPD